MRRSCISPRDHTPQAPATPRLHLQPPPSLCCLYVIDAHPRTHARRCSAAPRAAPHRRLFRCKSGSAFELGIAVLLAYIAYPLADVAMLSGIVAVFFNGIVMRAYLAPNLSDESEERLHVGTCMHGAAVHSMACCMHGVTSWGDVLHGVTCCMGSHVRLNVNACDPRLARRGAAQMHLWVDGWAWSQALREPFWAAAMQGELSTAAPPRSVLHCIAGPV